jgi:pilus assembly protein CpaE
MEGEKIMEKIRIYHIDQNEDALKLIKQFSQRTPRLHIISSTTSLEEGFDEIQRIFPDIVLIDENVAGGNLAPIIQKIILHSPYLGVIVTCTEYSKGKIRQYMNAGARDCLVKPFTATDLAQSVMKVHKYNQELKDHIVRSTTRILTRAPKMISIFSTKGGVGKSTVSTLLAAGLASLYKEDTAIIDLDLQFGDVSLLLDMKPQKTITNAIESIGQLTSSDLRKIMTKHHIGLHVLPSPLNPEEEDFITEEATLRMFKLAKEEFDYVIIDGPPGFNTQNIIALEQSDLVLLITSPELMALKNTKNGLRTLIDLGIDQDQIKVVVNRYSKKSNISISLIEDVLGLEVFATISNDYPSVIKFLNQGEPQLIYDGNGRISKDLRAIIEGLRTYHTVPAQKGKANIFQWLMQKVHK